MDANRVICCYGGSSSSKTISVLQWLTLAALVSDAPLVISIIGESVPVLKRSVIRDWQRVVMQDTYDEGCMNKNEMIYTFPNGSIFQFIPADAEERFYAMRHDYVMIDEAYNVRRGIFNQIEIRTRGKLFLTWNPVAEFWAKDLEDRPDCVMLHSTYKDNPFVEASIIKSLELRARTDPNFYRVFVLGKYGTYEGLIFKEGQHWSKCIKMPEEYQRRVIGVDFGFSHDPTAIMDIRYQGGEFWIDELAYEPGLFNSDIGKVLIAQGRQTESIADSAEPKSIAELSRMNLNIRPCQKGPDSVKFGLRTMQGFKLNVTERSINTIKELRNYSYSKDRDGDYYDKPIDNWNHAIDAIRYVVQHVRAKPSFGSYAVS